VVQNLRGDDAQAFIDVIDEVFSQALSTRKSRPTDLNPNFPSCQAAVGCPGTVAVEKVSEHFA